jgi:hypothetical protein
MFRGASPFPFWMAPERILVFPLFSDEAPAAPVPEAHAPDVVAPQAQGEEFSVLMAVY